MMCLNCFGNTFCSPKCNCGGEPQGKHVKPLAAVQNYIWRWVGIACILRIMFFLLHPNFGLFRSSNVPFWLEAFLYDLPLSALLICITLQMCFLCETLGLYSQYKLNQWAFGLVSLFTVILIAFSLLSASDWPSFPQKVNIPLYCFIQVG